MEAVFFALKGQRILAQGKAAMLINIGAAALGFKAPKTISRPVRARELSPSGRSDVITGRVALPLQGGYIYVVRCSQGVALG